MLGALTSDEEAQLLQTIEMFEVITQSQPLDYQSLEILKEAYLKLGRPKDVVSTSKRIAEAYVQLGQLSSAILEYETILQSHPDDSDVLAAMAGLEQKANSLTAPPISETDISPRTAASEKKKAAKKAAGDVEDGRKRMTKLFVDSRNLSASDFDLYWPEPHPSESPADVSEPFIHVLAEKGILPVEKSLKIISDATRIGFIPIERYDVDVELARGFPKDVCRRWCVLPIDCLSKSVVVATVNPFNEQAAEELRAATQNRLLWFLVPPLDLIKQLRKVFR